MKKIVLSLLISCSLISLSDTSNTSSSELKKIGEKIFLNETGGDTNKLIWWNSSENFPSLGIGHFIWYKPGEEELYQESFPGLIRLYKEKDIALPELFRKNLDAPWTSKNDLDNKKSTPEVREAIFFLANTKDIQVEYIGMRLDSSLETMTTGLDSATKNHVITQYNRVLSSNNGLYLLIDYVNFKGEGVNPKERYNGYGWGLLQVLEEMGDTVISPKEDFVNSAKFVLERRVENAPSSKKSSEKKWLNGWYRRIDTYLH